MTMPDDSKDLPILTVRGATVRFGAKHAVDAADLDLHRGRITAILGPSGAGKSTLLRAIAGFQPLSQGRIELDGTTLTDGARMMPAEERGIGMVVQDLALFPHLTAWRNVAFGLRGKDRARMLSFVKEFTGLTPLEVIQAATINGAREIYAPRGEATR